MLELKLNRVSKRSPGKHNIYIYIHIYDFLSFLNTEQLQQFFISETKNPWTLCNKLVNAIMIVAYVLATHGARASAVMALA